MIDLLVVALFQAVSGDPQLAEAPPAATEAAPAAGEQREFCRSVRVSGSRLPVRQCVTETELREVAEANESGTGEAAREGVRNTLRGGDRAGSQGNGFFQGGGGARR